MMSSDAIQSLSNQQARKAARRGLVPYVPYDEAEINGYQSFPFPSIGGHRPKGWDLIETWQVDKCGVGDRFSIGSAELKHRLVNRDRLEPTYGYAVIEQGEFQLVLGVFMKED